MNPIRYFLSFIMLDNKYHFRHCERTAMITYTLLGLVIVLSFLSITKGFNLIVFGSNILLIFVVSLIAGILGLIYYKIKKRR